MGLSLQTVPDFLPLLFQAAGFCRPALVGLQPICHPKIT
jgi:hypothetical protein